MDDLMDIMSESTVPKIEVVPVVTEKDSLEKSVKSDYDYVRDNMRTAINTCAQVMPNLINLAQQSESAAMFSTLTNFMKTFAEMNKTLLDSAASTAKASQKPRGKASKDENQEGKPETKELTMTVEDLLLAAIKHKPSEVIDNESE